MKERPILFSGAMVRALLDGKKTQTRRLIKGAPPAHETGRWTWTVCSTDRAQEGRFNYGILDPKGQTFTERGRERTVFSAHCPYGAPGDRLWVRETWCPGRGLAVVASPRLLAEAGAALAPGIIYRADGAELPAGCAWRPSIHMRRAFSRLTLEVTGVRVERLQDISEADARAEGVTLQEKSFYMGVAAAAPHRFEFHRLWQQINGERAPWLSNPWVWVVEFRRAP